VFASLSLDACECVLCGGVYVCVCVCVSMCECVCMCVCGGGDNTHELGAIQLVCV
jgi:hypothetical protein